jgi:hypothetical protein
MVRPSHERLSIGKPVVRENSRFSI